MHNVVMFIFALLLVLGIVLALGVYRLRLIGVAMLSLVVIACAVMWVGHITM